MVNAQHYAKVSERCLDGKCSHRLVDSRDAGWTSLLLDYRRDGDNPEPFELGPTPDQTVVVMTSGRQRVASYSRGVWRQSTYRTGTVGLTPPHQVDRLRLDASLSSVQVRKATVYLPQQLIDDAAEHLRRPGQRFRRPELNALASEDEVLAQTVMSLVGAVRAGAPELLAQTAAQWLATHLIMRHDTRRSLAEDSRRTGVIDTRALTTVTEYMRAHLGDPLTVQQLADLAHVSKYHFTRLFRAQVGVSPYAYLVHLRLQTARRLLVTTDDSVAHIAARCGFSSAPHFSARFVREFGLTPSAWRVNG